MAVYSGSGSNMQLQEHDLYGSSRLGMINNPSAVTAGQNPQYLGSKLGNGFLVTFSRGKKLFELSNHLGNVQVNISDRKLLQTDGTYAANIVSANDYYPFGMQMPGRTYNSGNYRYGFNGKEKDPETGYQNYGMREYSPATARFISVDPLTKKYTELTPYQFASNTPIQAVDLDGAEALLVHGTWSDKTTWEGGFVKNMLHATGWDKIQKNAYFGNCSGANNSNARTGAANDLFNFLTSDKNPYRDLKHATLIGHSHGGNVNKILRNKLQKEGWTVDIVNIETPQRTDFNTGKGGRGVYLNFYSKFDIVQFGGALGKRWESGSRTDYAADKNIELLECIPIPIGTIPVNSITQWFKDLGGHSLHNNELSKSMIINETQKAFDANKK